MNKITKTVLALCLAGSLLFSAFGCNNNSSANNNAGNTNVSGRPKVLPEYEMKTEIIFDALLGAKANEKSYQIYKDCGYNALIVSAGAFGPSIASNVHSSSEELNRQLEEVFQLCEKFGFKATLAMANMSEGKIIKPFQFYDDILRPTLQKWKDSDVFYGFWQGDEWSLDTNLYYTEGMGGGVMQRKSYEDFIDFLLDDYLYFSKEYPGKRYSHNLLGSPNGGEDMGYFETRSKDTEKYLEWYYERLLKFMPIEDRIISYDAYPFNVYGFKDCYVASLNDFALASEKAGANKTNWVQNYKDIENANMITYQYYTSMAYGYTNFITYCYSDAWHPEQYSVEIGGRPTDNYYYFQKAHKDVKVMQEVYSNFCDSRVGTMCFEGTEEIDANRLRPWIKCTDDMMPSYSAIESVTSTKDLILSVFKDGDNNDGFMLANQMLPKTIERNTVTMKITDAKQAAVWKDGKPLEIVQLTDGVLTTVIESGGGAFIVPLY